MATIKLLKIDTLSDGTQRFQSQLYVGRTVADFIMKPDGVMMCYGELHGFGFYEYKEPYEIVSDISDMATQIL